MATVYPTAAGNYSTRTYNDDATGVAYGSLPLAGDTVLANGLAITLDVDITISGVSLKTIAGTTAVAGGGFTTTGTRSITADSYAGSTSCLTLATGGTQIGNSFGSTTTNTTFATVINSGGVQIGDSTGGNLTNRNGTQINPGGVQTGNATGGSGNNANGTINSGGVQTGDSTGGSASNAMGTRIDSGGVQNGDSFAGSVANAFGSELFFGGVQNGDSTGGSVSGAHGTRVASGSIHHGNATGGSASGAHGTQLLAGGMAFIDTATGNTSGAFGVQSTVTTRYVAIIKAESGSFAKSLTSAAETTNANVPFTGFSSVSGSSSILSHGTFS
jgi:hypothetical protein